MVEGEHVQKGMTEMVKGMEQLLFGKRLKRLGLFILENGEFRGNMTGFYKTIKVIGRLN